MNFPVEELFGFFAPDEYILPLKRSLMSPAGAFTLTSGFTRAL